MDKKIADGWPLFDYSKTITKGDSDEIKIFFFLDRKKDAVHSSGCQRQKKWGLGRV